jgi:hypothetical protein
MYPESIIYKKGSGRTNYEQHSFTVVASPLSGEEKIGATC